MDQQQQYTFVREGQMYHAGKETIDVLKAVQQWDPGAAQEIFDRGRENGRVGEGSVVAIEQARTTRAQGHGNEQSL